VLLAVLPLSFIRLLNISSKHKIGLSVLMGLGVAATGVSVAKLYVFYRDWNHEYGDFTYYTTKIVALAWIEVYIGVIATCLPALRSFFDTKISHIVNNIKLRTHSETDQSVPKDSWTE
jgi:hypothetical protein